MRHKLMSLNCMPMGRKKINFSNFNAKKIKLKTRSPKLKRENGARLLDLRE